MPYYHYPSSIFCGCWYVLPNQYNAQYLPLVDLASHTTILATTSRTKLTQTFHNPSKTSKLEEVQYTFPLYDGVSVVSFKCTVADKVIVGVVKEKQQARKDYQAAVDRGETAGLLEQVPDASDAFTTKIGNIPADEKVIVEIEYLGELKHDAETDGSRFTIPTVIAPRYGSPSSDVSSTSIAKGISIAVDVIVDEGTMIRGIQSPSHPVAVTMGRISTTEDEDAFETNQASATLTLGSTVLEKDFVIIVLAKGQEIPRALLETHPTIPNQRALMATLVPKFNLPNSLPEIVFVVDRSGSMGGKMKTLIAAMKVFLKSLPIGVKFNVCSFGSRYEFMFKKSRTYDEGSLQEALKHLNHFDANFGGTEMFKAVEATIKNRLRGMPLETLVLTDGEIWNQDQLFSYINTASADGSVRVFSLGIGSGASSSLVEGIARAGDGFAQFVDDHEKMDKRVVRMLKGALSPHIRDYRLEIKYEESTMDTDEEFEIINSVDAGLANLAVDAKKSPSPIKQVISLFDPSAKETPTNPNAGRYDHLPKLTPPAVLQAPHKVPTLYPFNRTTVYLLLGPNARQLTPSAIVLRATSEHGPLELEIPVQDIGVGQTLHQLAAKKAVHELEQGRGWLSDSSLKKKFAGTSCESRMDELVEREAVRLGVEFQVGGKFCSFVAVEGENFEQEQLDPPEYELFEGAEKKEVMKKSSVARKRGVSKDKASPRNFGIPTSASSTRSRVASQDMDMSFASVTPLGASKQRSSVSRFLGGGGLFGSAAKPAAPSMSVPISANSFAAPPPAPRPSGFGASSTSAVPGGSLSGSAAPAAPSFQQQGQTRFFRKTAANVEAKQSVDLDSDDEEDEDEGVARAEGGTAFSFSKPPPAPAPYLHSSSSRRSAAPLSQTAASVPALPASALSDEDKVTALIDLNAFDGSWTTNDSKALAQIIGKADWDILINGGKGSWSEKAKITAAVVAFLQIRMKSEEEVWEMVVEKALGWLKKNVTGDEKDDVEKTVGELRALLK